MLIALDYDGTYTEDPMLWDMFILNARLTGHKVYCVTMRYKETESADVDKALLGKVDRIIYTGRKAKKPYVWLNYNESPQVWIDDIPEFINEDAMT